MATLNMAPLQLDIVGVRAGDANSRRYRITQDGEAFDLTGYAINAQARKKSNDALPSLTAVITPIDLSEGLFWLAWPGDEVSDLLGGAAVWSGVWDLQVHKGTDPPITIAGGKLKCEQDVTRP